MLKKEKIPLTLINHKQRECRPCTACCTVIGVHELSKGMNTKCDNESEGRCGIYECRPSSCRNFACMYQTGQLEGGEEMRPDNLGILFVSHQGQITVHEVRKGATEEPKAQIVIRRLARILKLIVHDGVGWKYFN